MRIAVGLSGGVDSSMAARLLQEEGHDITGVYLSLWGGARQGSSCSTADGAAARRVATHLGIPFVEIDHREAFEQQVIAPFVAAAQEGRTLNPCLSCNKSFKIEEFLAWALREGFDAVATGHHARVVRDARGVHLGRSVDTHKDQSYVLSMITPAQLEHFLLPLGVYTKDTIRELARGVALPSAEAPDSMDLCFSGPEILTQHGVSTAAELVDVGTGARLGSIQQAEALTVGQRKGLGIGGADAKRYVVSLDLRPFSPRVMVGTREELQTLVTPLEDVAWAHGPLTDELDLQTSSGGRTHKGTIQDGVVHWSTSQSRVTPGQAVVFYRGGLVVGSGTAA